MKGHCFSALPPFRHKATDRRRCCCRRRRRCGRCCCWRDGVGDTERRWLVVWRVSNQWGRRRTRAQVRRLRAAAEIQPCQQVQGLYDVFPFVFEMAQGGTVELARSVVIQGPPRKGAFYIFHEKNHDHFYHLTVFKHNKNVLKCILFKAET